MPVLPDEFPPHPARDASLKSMTAVEAGDREAWLDLFADVTSRFEEPPFMQPGLGSTTVDYLATRDVAAACSVARWPGWDSAGS